jgi:hypothetical protein
MQGVEVADWLSVAIFVLVLKIAMELWRALNGY